MRVLTASPRTLDRCLGEEKSSFLVDLKNCLTPGLKCLNVNIKHFFIDPRKKKKIPNLFSLVVAYHLSMHENLCMYRWVDRCIDILILS